MVVHYWRTIVLLLAAGFFVVGAAEAQWIQSGIQNQSVAALAISHDTAGTVLLAGTFGHGLFFSTNNGANWIPGGIDLEHSSVVTLAVSTPANGCPGPILFAGTEQEGVFRSTDGGRSWTAVNKGLPVSGSGWRVNARSTTDTRFAWRVNALVLNPASGGSHDVDNLFAGFYSGGVFRSTNDGAGWLAANDGLRETSPAGVFGAEPRVPVISALAVNSGYLFAGTYGNGVFLSTNNGASWSNVSNGLPIDESFIAVYALAISPASTGMGGNSLFAGTSNGGAFRTKDDGLYWARANFGLPNDHVVAFAVSRTSGANILFAGLLGSGVFLSTDDGKRWTDVNAGLSNRNVFTLVAVGDTLFAGTSAGVWKCSILEILSEVKKGR